MMPARSPSPCRDRRTPITGKRGIEHLAEPVNHDGVTNLTQNVAIDAPVVLRSPRQCGQRATGHQDDAAVERLDRPDLGLVGGDDLVDCLRRPGGQMIRAGTAADDDTRAALRLGERTPDELVRARPVQAHAALGRVHRLSHAEAEIPEVVTKAQRRIPVDRGAKVGVAVRQRIDHDMRGCVRDTVEHRGGGALHGRCDRGIAQPIRFDAAAGYGQPTLIIPGHPRRSCAGTRQRRNVDPAPLRPALHRQLGQLHALRTLQQVVAPGVSATTWRRKSSHWRRKPLRNLGIRHGAPLVDEFHGLRYVGIPHRARRIDPVLGHTARQSRNRRTMCAVDMKGDQVVAADARRPATN